MEKINTAYLYTKPMNCAERGSTAARIIILNSMLLFALSSFAKDSLNLKATNKKWQIEIAGNYNYNYRKIGAVTYDGIIERSIINEYLDTGNISCYTKNIGLLISRKLGNVLSFQTGVYYGRRGYMYSRQLVSFSNGRQASTSTYIKYIPEKMVNIPFKIMLIIPTLKQKLQFGASFGLDFNFYTKRDKIEDPNFYFYNESYLKEETNGFFGFTPTRKLPKDTKLLHDKSTPLTTPYLQYNLGVFIQIKIYKSIFTNFRYNYISQPVYSESNEYYYNSFPFQQGKGGFRYEVRPYIHSYGIGLGFEF
jgi:hypothetical protein